jgi:hypothetical protein
VSRVVHVAPLSGFVFAVLFGLGSGLWAFDQPARGADSDELLAFFEGTSTEILIGGTMSIVSIVFLVWFGAILRERLIAAEGSERSGLPLVAFAGSVLLAAVGLGAETINIAGALSARDGQLTADTAQIYFDLSYAFGAQAAGVAIAMIALPTGLTALRTGRVVPRWAAWLALFLGIATLTPALLNRAAFLVLYAATVLLLAACSLYLFRVSTD